MNEKCVISISQYHIVVSLQDCSTAVVWRYLRSQFSTASLQTATKSPDRAQQLSVYTSSSSSLFSGFKILLIEIRGSAPCKIHPNSRTVQNRPYNNQVLYMVFRYVQYYSLQFIIKSRAVQSVQFISGRSALERCNLI